VGRTTLEKDPKNSLPNGRPVIGVNGRAFLLFRVNYEGGRGWREGEGLSIFGPNDRVGIAPRKSEVKLGKVMKREDIGSDLFFLENGAESAAGAYQLPGVFFFCERSPWVSLVVLFVR